MIRSTTTTTVLTLFLAVLSMASADMTLRRLRHKEAPAALLEDSVYDHKYLDLADLVTDELTLHLVEERRRAAGGGGGPHPHGRKMIGFDDFDVLTDDIRIFELDGMSVSPSEAPTAAPELSMSMSMP
jgi:hypothetical protein